MNDFLAPVQTALDALRTVTAGRSASGLAPGDLVVVNEAFGMLRRRLEAAYLPVAAEISRQSRPELGSDSLARQQGFRNAGRMISTTTGTTVGEAHRLVTVGEATAPRLTLAGEAMPARHPRVAAGVTDGLLSTVAAAEIVGMLDRIATRAGSAEIDAMEVRLVEAAPGLAPDQLRVLVARAEALLDPDGIEPREERLRADRSLSLREDGTGMLLINGRLDPETAAPVKTAIDGIVSGILGRNADLSRGRSSQAGTAEAGATEAGTAETDADTRTFAQLRADALADLCRHMTGCENTPTGSSTTVVIRMSLSDLQQGTGHGTIDGLSSSVSASTVRRMAADARVIPCVLGGESEILDWGRARRLFTPVQKLALAERDGGCAFCGLPPALTAAHHIAWWNRDAGPTDLNNGVLLCTSCHHRIHDNEWTIRIDGTGTTARVWFTPPPWLDPTRTPRLGGRARFDLAADPPGDTHSPERRCAFRNADALGTDDATDDATSDTGSQGRSAA